MSLFETAATEFQRRHIGPDGPETAQMLKSIGVSGLDELMNQTVPQAIRMRQALVVNLLMRRVRRIGRDLLRLLQNGHSDTLFSRFNAKVVSELGVVCQGIFTAVSDSGHQCNVRFGLSARVYLLVSIC